MKKIKSLYNGELEISSYRGKKILDGQKVNLSYGSVHSIWRRGLKNLNTEHLNHILLLGLGGGSVVSILRNELNYKGKLTAIELDPVMIAVAAGEFGIKNSFNQKIKEDNAFDFIAATKLKFDLVLCDVFIESKVAPEVFKKDFWNDIDSILVPGGKIIVNVSTSGSQLARSKALMEKEKERFRFYIIRKAGGSNTLIKAIKK